MARLFARAAFGVFVVVLWVGAARSATPAGSVVAISGQCYVESDGKRTALKFADKVNVADTVDVPAGAKLKLRMNDGSIISVAASSQLTIASYTIDADGKRHDVELSLGQGLMRAVVAPIDRPARFEVNTALAAAAVRSTDWFIEAQPGVATVAVLVGGVGLTSKATNASVLVPARSGSSVEAGHDPTAPHVLRQAEFNALIARTEPPVRRRATRRAEPVQGYNPPGGPPGGDGPPPWANSGPPPDQYGPGPGGQGPPPGGGYYPYPGGSPPGGYGPRPGGTYQPPRGGAGQMPGGMQGWPSHSTHPN
ncbi:MAG: FecR domain-containing protein [Alphaproteobacteria bacterium]